MSKKILILTLGKGQAKLNNAQSFDYRKAHYFFSSNNKEVKTTPFVGEAIITLSSPESFDEVYILGTPDSMWHTLYAHSIEDTLDEKKIAIFDTIEGAIKHRNISKDPSIFRAIAEEFENLVGIPTKCLETPVGTEETELWRIFEVIANIPDENDTVSIDITHGLRFHPFLTILAIEYFKNIKNISIKNVFYGAFELSGNHKVLDKDGTRIMEEYIDKGETKQKQKELTPIYDLKPITELLDWIKSANAFNKYGDIKPLLTNLSDSLGKTQIQGFENFAKDIQLSNTKTLKNSANQFLSVVASIGRQEESKLKPLQLIEPILRTFPNKIVNSKTEWEILLEIAERQIKTGQISNAVTTTWEAIITRIANIYEKDASNFRIYQSCVAIAKKDKKISSKEILNTKIYVDDLEGFYDKVRDLSKLRNALVHIRENDDINKNDVYDRFIIKDGLFDYFKKHLGNEKLDNLKIYYDFPEHD